MGTGQRRPELIWTFVDIKTIYFAIIRTIGFDSCLIVIIVLVIVESVFHKVNAKNILNGVFRFVALNLKLKASRRIVKTFIVNRKLIINKFFFYNNFCSHWVFIISVYTGCCVGQYRISKINDRISEFNFMTSVELKMFS